MEPQFQVLPPEPNATVPPGPPPRRANPQGILGWIIAGGIAVFKFGFLVIKSLKTSLSMLLMIWTYSWFFGWPYATGIVLLIFVHEMGHVIAAKWLGLPVTAPLFIPFVGAAILMKQNPRDAWTEALIAFGGPFAGCIGSWLCWYAAIKFESNLLMAVASTSFVINLFNMIPVPPLDGGRMCAAVSTWFWLLGLVMLGAAVLYFHAWSSIFIIVIVLLVAFPRIKETLFNRATPEMQAYYNTHISDRATMALLYLGLTAALLLGYWDASQHLSYLWETQSSGW